MSSRPRKKNKCAQEYTTSSDLQTINIGTVSNTRRRTRVIDTVITTSVKINTPTAEGFLEQDLNLESYNEPEPTLGPVEPGGIVVQVQLKAKSRHQNSVCVYPLRMM